MGYDQNAYGMGQQMNPQPMANPAPMAGAGMALSGSAIELKVVKPTEFKNASQIADHLLNRRTVVLNLEATDKDTARRLIDFLTGVAYSIDGQIKRVANNAYVITPNNVDISGDQMRRSQQQAQPQPQPQPQQFAGEEYYSDLA
ncbi:MAG: cell division protein SepF [Clostridia bacterium]|nr:cell division protein SepF [Clostridia bacterium]